jgi:hypothetical protein
VFSYWYFVVLFVIVALKYLQRNRMICHIKFSFFFFEKIDCFVRVEKLRFIEYDVAIIIYVVFLWISDSKDIDEVIFYLKTLNHFRWRCSLNQTMHFWNRTRIALNDFRNIFLNYLNFINLFKLIDHFWSTMF